MIKDPILLNRMETNGKLKIKLFTSPRQASQLGPDAEKIFEERTQFKPRFLKVTKPFNYPINTKDPLYLATTKLVTSPLSCSGQSTNSKTQATGLPNTQQRPSIFDVGDSYTKRLDFLSTPTSPFENLSALSPISAQV